MFDKILYKMHSSGKVGSWRIFVEESCGVVTMVRQACKVLGGKPVETPTEFTEGKNIGRSNETTPLEQALLEAESKYKKQLDKGYVVEQPEAGATVTNALGFKKPMLAININKVKNWTYPVYAQPKLDGHRLLNAEKRGIAAPYSRQGKPVSVAHIEKGLNLALVSQAWFGDILDGEAYIHGMVLQKIASLIKKPRPESKQLTYTLYDVMVDEPYKKRLAHVQGIAKFVTEQYGPGIVEAIETHIINSDEELEALHADFIGRGYEGTIVRWGDGGYEDDKRSQTLLKKKDFLTAEFKVIGHKEGKPRIRPEGTLRVPVWRCVTDDGKEFDVLAQGTMFDKHDQFMGAEGYYGQMLTTKFFCWTPDGKPFHGVALRWREDI